MNELIPFFSRLNYFIIQLVLDGIKKIPELIFELTLIKWSMIFLNSNSLY